MGYAIACVLVGAIGLAWLYLALDAIVNGNPFKWAWRQVRRQPPP